MKTAMPTIVAGGVPRVNLMPRAETERRERAALARKWGVGLLAALTVVMLASAAAFWVRWGAEQQLAAEQARSTELLTELSSLSSVSQALSMRTELQGFRADAMVADVGWTDLFADLATALPAGVAVTGFDLETGAAPVTDEPVSELALVGTLELTSPTLIDIAATVRSLREVAGVSVIDPFEATTSVTGDSVQPTYVYRLRTAFDQTLYTGAFAEEATE